MGIITLPDLPAGSNPYALIYTHIHYTLNPAPTEGFHARLYATWTLAGYGVVAAVVYLFLMAVENRRREKRFWLWKLVTRPNGRYIVGNQNALFAIFSFISCALLLGYNVNFYRVVLLHQYQQRAYFWRSLIWIPLVLHAWISSWSNLQAAVLSSQKATKRHLLSPKFANAFYVVGLNVILLPVIILGVYLSITWRRAWNFGLNLRALILARMVSNPTDTAEEALATINVLFTELNSRLDFFLRLIRADHAVYAFAMLVIISTNVGGLGLLFTLQRQINFNSGRLSTQIRNSTHTGHTSVHGVPVLSANPESSASSHPDSPEAPHPLSPNPNAHTAAHKTVLRHVLFIRGVGGDGEKGDKRMSVSQLKDAASDRTPAGAAQRQQAKQLLALKKIQWDLIVFLLAIVVMATVFLALALWLVISPNSVYSSWKSMEVSFYLVPWMYLVGVDASLTFLLFNSTRHLLSSNSRLAHVVGLQGRTSRIDRHRESLTGLTTSDELESSTMSYSRQTRRGAEGVLEDVDEGEDEVEERGIHVAIETEIVEESPERLPMLQMTREHTEEHMV